MKKIKEKRSLFGSMFGSKKPDSPNLQRFELLSDSNNIFSSWNGKTFDSDIVRSAVRPKANAVGKLNPKHIRGTGPDMKINPAPWVEVILNRPNPYMSMQDLLTKLTFKREIDNNAFAYIKRDPITDNPAEIYPIPYNNIELLEAQGQFFIKFWFRIGKFMVVPYIDLIHLRKDFYSNDILGDSGNIALNNIMEVINTTDQGIVNAVKNSAVIKWIMKFPGVIRTDDQQVAVDAFVKNYLAIDKASGVAVQDGKYELTQIEPKSYVPNSAQMKDIIQRLYAYFGVNDAIVQNKYDENGWNAFYESEIEPIAIQLSNAFTGAFFSVREISFGNQIIFEASALEYSSMQTKLGLVAMVDRGAMTPNEWRKILNLAPIEGGDKPIRRLDTALINQTDTNTGGTDNGNNQSA